MEVVAFVFLGALVVYLLCQIGHLNERLTTQDRFCCTMVERLKALESGAKADDELIGRVERLEGKR